MGGNKERCGGNRNLGICSVYGSAHAFTVLSPRMSCLPVCLVLPSRITVRTTASALAPLPLRTPLEGATAKLLEGLVDTVRRCIRADAVTMAPTHERYALHLWRCMRSSAERVTAKRQSAAQCERLARSLEI